MANIKYTSIINSFVSTEGGGGAYINRVYYSILVVYTDGKKSVVEGTLQKIQSYLAYVRTPMDYLNEILDSVNSLRKDFNSIIDQKVEYIIDSLYPIPNIQGINEVEAINILKNAGLVPVLDNEYPESTPPIGTVRNYTRSEHDFKSVNVKIIRDVPAVIGLNSADALKMLREAGFSANISYVTTTDNENDIVLGCDRVDDNKLKVSLSISRLLPDVKGMLASEANKLLEEAGFEINEIKKYTDMYTPGIVLKYEHNLNNRITLLVSDSDTYTSKNVKVSWSNMQDSSGDKYTAIAKLSRVSQNLTIELSYESGAKSKHFITGITTEPKDLNPYISPKELESNGTVRISVVSSSFLETIPDEIECTLHTNYGMLKKPDQIFLKFEIEW